MSWLQLANRTCIVTGAGSGIGAAVVKALTSCENNCHVVMADRDLDSMKDVVVESSSLFNNDDDTNNNNTISKSQSNSSYELVQCDVTDPNQVQDLIRQADDYAAANTAETSVPHHHPHHHKAATLLVNCAGITKDGWISKMPLEDWDDVLDVNLKATFMTCRYFLNQKRIDMLFPKEGGNTTLEGRLTTTPNASIVNVGSIVSERGNLGQVNYAASKGGVLGLTRALAKEMANRKINVNAVVPGFIDSPMTRAVPNHVKEHMISQIPQKRFGQPNEVADLICFLLSPRSSYITGESIHVSGMISL